jgi:hypothetical protein
MASENPFQVGDVVRLRNTPDSCEYNVVRVSGDSVFYELTRAPGEKGPISVHHAVFELSRRSRSEPAVVSRDGVPIQIGDEGIGRVTGRRAKVTGFSDDGLVIVKREDGRVCRWWAAGFIHAAPSASAGEKAPIGNDMVDAVAYATTARRTAQKMCPVPCVCCGEEFPAIETMVRYVGGDQWTEGTTVQPLCAECGDQKVTCDASLLEMLGNWCQQTPLEAVEEQLALVARLTIDLALLSGLDRRLMRGDVLASAERGRRV